MNTKNWIRIAVVAALLAWPGVETLRYFVAKKQLAASLERQHSVQIELARLKSGVQVAAKPASNSKP